MEDLQNLSNIQKAAALLIFLGPQVASQVMKNITEESEVERIALEIASMKTLPPHIMREILEEFLSLFEANKHLSTGGVMYARQVLEDVYGPDHAERILERMVATLQTNPFDFFNKADPIQLATSFQNENPQLVALVLAYLKPEQSAAILGMLPPELQAEVAARIAEMDRTNPDVLREVERILENKFSSVVMADFTVAGGIEALAEILNRSDRTTEKSILDGLEIKDPEVAEKVRELMFVFEDIIHLDDRSIQRILREVDTKDLAFSLKGAGNEVRDKIIKNMSERAAGLLMEDMEYMGPVKAKDVLEKQTHIVRVIRALEASGEINIARGGGAEEDYIE